MQSGIISEEYDLWTGISKLSSKHIETRKIYLVLHNAYKSTVKHYTKQIESRCLCSDLVYFHSGSTFKQVARHNLYAKPSYCIMAWVKSGFHLNSHPPRPLKGPSDGAIGYIG